ncbi:MAG: phosphoribosylamine--glycine ligase [Bacteroidales bacterium]|nr:phosphoribosylamine--glycine ligase [Bacteroidales bacterium]
MNVLVLGSGGREHTLAWKISQSKYLSKLYISPGNAGTSQLGENIEIGVNNFKEIKDFIKNKSIDILVVGPEEPLVKGLYDYLKKDDKDLVNLIIIGPTGRGAKLEGSKEFAKKFMEKNKIPSAKYRSFTKDEIRVAIDFLKELTPPYVLKADGLAAGKGVVILNSINEAEKELAAMFEGKFGDAGKIVVIEEYLEGIEASVFIITDGENYLLLPEAKDYKRIGEGDTGLNTGGMGAVSPIPFFTKELINRIEDRIIKPTISGLRNEGIIYRGFIFFGLMIVNEDPYVIEYNVRMGDPEAEVVIPRIKNDLLEIFIKLSEKKLNTIKLEIEKSAACTVMMVSGGYPEKYEKGKLISIKEKINGSIIYHAGTKSEGSKIFTNGGRVLAITSYGENIFKALEKSYENIKNIDFENKYYRKDIGFDL